jgi:hypothetical protein
MLRCLALLLLPLVPVMAQQPDFKADKVIRDGPVLRGTGHVEARVGGLVLTGDSGSINTETDDVEVAGKAKVTLPARSDRTLLRYSGGAFISGDPVIITADRLAVRSGLLLRGYGNVLAASPQARLEGAELELFLKIGDGDVRGNVRLNGAVPEGPGQRVLRRYKLPAEIWK